MRLDDALDDAESEAVAANLARLGGRATIERLEDVRQVLRGDAEAVVLDRNRELVAASWTEARFDADPLVGAAVLQGVADQVLDGGPQRRAVGQYRRQPRRNVGLDDRRRLVDRGGRCADRFRNECLDAGRRQAADGSTPFDAGVEQHALDGVTEAARFR